VIAPNPLGTSQQNFISRPPIVPVRNAREDIYAATGSATEFGEGFAQRGVRALFGLWAPPVAAQHASAAGRDALQEITVTARKVSQNDAEVTAQVETALHSDRYV
jgi:hypothetical protein